jgi:hypothetical protein
MRPLSGARRVGAVVWLAAVVALYLLVQEIGLRVVP